MLLFQFFCIVVACVFFFLSVINIRRYDSIFGVQGFFCCLGWMPVLDIPRIWMSERACRL